MRFKVLIMFFVVGFGISFIDAAQAASCNNVRPSSKRMACLQKKISNLTVSLDKTRGELKAEAAKQVSLEAALTATRNDLDAQIEKMTALDARIAAAENGLNSAIKSGESVNIQSHVFVDKCLDQRSNPNPTPQADEVRMVTCVFTDPADKWTLTR